MGGNHGIEKIFAEIFEGLKRPSLIFRHQAAIANHICRKNSCEATFHKALPQQEVTRGLG